MYKKIWILVISVILILTFSGSIIAKEVLSAKIELKDGSVITGEIKGPFLMLVKTKDGMLKIEAEDVVSIWFFSETPSATPVKETLSTAPANSIESNNFTWNLQDPSISVYFTGGKKIEGFNERFWEELSKAFPTMSIWGRESLVSLYEHHRKPGEGLQRLMDSDTIFLIHPKDIKYLEDLEAEYPNLLPLSCSKLKSYPFPLLYFTRDVQTDKIRGVIIADKVDTSLIKLLTEKALPLDIPLEYISSIKPSDSTWNLQNPLILTYLTVRPRVKGADEGLWKELIKILRVNIWGMPSLVSMEEKDIQRLMESHTIFLIHSKNLKYLQELETKYPNLLPLSCNKLKSYRFPLFYFSRNVQTDKIRGIIISDKVDASLAKLLTENALPLDIPFKYENGQLQVLNE